MAEEGVHAGEQHALVHGEATTTEPLDAGRVQIRCALPATVTHAGEQNASMFDQDAGKPLPQAPVHAAILRGLAAVLRCLLRRIAPVFLVAAAVLVLGLPVRFRSSLLAKAVPAHAPFSDLGGRQPGAGNSSAQSRIIDLFLHHPVHLNDHVAKVACTVDVTQTVFRLAMAGNYIAHSVDWCKKQDTDKERIKCAKGLLGTVISIQFAVAAVAAAVSDCSGSLHVPAWCAQTIAAFTGELEALATAAMTSTVTCSKANLVRNVEAWERANQNLGGRRLQQAVNGLEVSNCVSKTSLAATFLMQAGVNIADGTLHCASEFELVKGTADAHRICAVDITSVLGVVGLAAKFLAGAANNCALITGDGNKEATCASDILNMYGATVAALSPGLNLKAACGGVGPPR